MPADSFAPDMDAAAASVASPALTAAALAQLSEGVIVTDADGRIQFVNAAAARLHGVAQLDVGVDDYAPTYHLLTEDGQPYPSAELPLARAVLRGETVLDARWRIRRPDGSEILAIGSARPVLSASGERLGSVLTLRDDTARVDAERADRRATHILAQMADEHLTMDRDFRILSLNEAAQRALGVTAAAIIGRTHWEAFPASVGTDVERQYRRVAAERVEAHFAAHYVGEGYDRHLEIDAYPTDDGGIALFWRDVSARVRAELAERAAVDQLRQLGVALQEQNDQLQEQSLEVELSNQQLHDQAIELELSNQQLQDQAAELEQQSAELELVATALGERSDEAERARTAAEESERRFRATADAAPVLIWTSGPDAEFDWFNQVWLDFTGRTMAEETGHGWAERVHPDDVRRCLDSHLGSVHDRRAFEREYRLRRHDGEYRWLLDRGVPRFGGDGHFLGFIGSGVDVTDRRASEQALADRERQFRTLADAIPTLAWTARVDGYIDWYNARWYEYTGTTPDEMEGWGWQSVHDSATLPIVLEEWTLSIATGQPFEMTIPLRGADGRFRPFLTRVIPVTDDAGTITRWFGTNTDVEAAVSAAARIERLQALTAALAAAVTVDEVADVVVAVAATGMEGAEATTAALFLRVPGTSNEALIVRQSGLHADVLSEYGRFTLDMPGPGAECLRTGDAIFVEQRDGPAGLLARFPGMPHVWERLGTHALATVPLAVAGEVTGAMSFTFDAPHAFTDADRGFFLAVGRQAAQALERARLLEAERGARAAAEAANRVKAEFLSTMSHELRTPLNAIGGYAELLQMGLRGPVTEAQSIDLARIRSAGQHLQSLINDILNFARLEAGHVHFDPQDVAVNGALADVVTLMLPQLRERGLEQECAPAEPDGLAVRADPEKLRQILLNLLTNAIKFTASGGRITLECAIDGDDGRSGGARVLMRVADTGRGIPADQLGRIFEPFVQVDRHLTGASQQGVGLGLAISRDLARAMGGDLTVESTLGAGSTFTLSLPRA